MSKENMTSAKQSLTFEKHPRQEMRKEEWGGKQGWERKKVEAGEEIVKDKEVVG